MEKEKTKYADKGDKVKVEKCPRCKEQLVVSMKDGGTEVFECKNCRFIIKKK